MFGTRLAVQNDTHFMFSTLFASNLMVELTKQKGAKVPELLRCACNPDSSQIARNKKETETSSF